MSTNDELKNENANGTKPVLGEVVCLEPTLALRVNLWGNRNGIIEQMWRCKFSGVTEWKPLPTVCEPNNFA